MRSRTLTPLVHLAAAVGALTLFVAGCQAGAVAGPSAIPPYRRADWPHWLDLDQDCQDTRQEVLIAESHRPVRLDTRGCRVLQGEWHDPYSGEVVTAPSALDIDHLVPLALAHHAGGWRWSRATKVAYANDERDPDHLVAVVARYNRQKAAQGPSTWLPPSSASHCWYLRAIERVVQRWALALPAADRAVLRQGLIGCGPPRQAGFTRLVFLD